MKFDIDIIKDSTPKNLRSYITSDLVELLNNSNIDDTILDEFKDNFITYVSVLNDGKYKIKDYVNAIKFVTLRLLNRNCNEAYIATFPDRYRRLKDKGITDISSYSSNYNKNKLVTAIMEQVLVPVWITNARIHQQAINEQFKIGTDESASYMARVKALDSVLTHTAMPENKNLNIEIGVSKSDDIQQLQNTMKELVVKQKELIENGYDTKNILDAKIIDVEAIDE